MEIKANFGLAADKYSRFRPTYPAAIYETIYSWLDEGKYSRAMDIGAGTGLSSVPLTEKFEEVISVEPDFDMYVKMKDYFVSIGKNIECENKFVKDLETEKGSVDLITFATAFYWTDGAEIMGKLKSLLSDTGVLAVYRYDIPIAPQGMREIIYHESSKVWDEFRHERLRDTEYSDRTIRESGLFSKVVTSVIENFVELSVEELVGFFASTSYVSAYLRSIENADAYLNNLIASLKEKANSERFPVDFQLELILAK